MSSSCYAVVAGGGTLGHLTPGMAVARELVDRGHSMQSIHFVGSSRGVEATEVPEAGFALTLLPGRGIQRRLTIENLGAIIGIVRGIVTATLLLRRLKPKVVLSTGGYASVPCVIAAAVWRIPVVVAESNAVAGAANRLGSRIAKVSAIAFESANLRNQILTGNPVRSEMLAMAQVTDSNRKQTAQGYMDVPGDGPLLAVFGGSLGARRINETVLAVASERPKTRVYHIIGHRDWSMLASQVASTQAINPGYKAVEFEQHMERVLAGADLVLSRSGATSVAEIAAVGVGAILVPLPIATGDHQTANATALTDVGAARLLKDAELNVSTLTTLLEELLGSEKEMDTMANAAKSVAHLDAAAKVADLIEEHAAR